MLSVDLAAPRSFTTYFDKLTSNQANYCGVIYPKVVRTIVFVLTVAVITILNSVATDTLSFGKFLLVVTNCLFTLPINARCTLVWFCSLGCYVWCSECLVASSYIICRRKIKNDGLYCGYVH